MTSALRPRGRRSRFTCIAAAGLVAACGSTPPPPDWQMNAKGSLERSTQAYLSGNERIESVEFARARAEIARTGRADLLARAELTRCAARVASLVFDDCPGYAAIAQDAAPAERAYAEFLAGKGSGERAALLPAAQRDVAEGKGSATRLAQIDDPFSRLVAAGVLLRTGQAEPAVFTLAADTASSQGWRRPLLAWLNLQLKRAEAGADATQAERLRRRIGLVLGDAR
jgi:hypothetical protein